MTHRHRLPLRCAHAMGRAGPSHGPHDHMGCAAYALELHFPSKFLFGEAPTLMPSDLRHSFIHSRLFLDCDPFIFREQPLRVERTKGNRCLTSTSRLHALMFFLEVRNAENFFDPPAILTSHEDVYCFFFCFVQIFAIDFCISVFDLFIFYQVNSRKKPLLQITQ